MGRLSGVRQENIYLSARYIRQKYGYPIERLCSVVHLNRSSYYKWLNRSKSRSELENEQIIEWIKELYEEQNGILGYRQMTVTINREKNVRYNQKRIRRLMKILRLQSVCLKKRYHYVKSTPEVTVSPVNRDNVTWQDFCGQNIGFGTGILTADTYQKDRDGIPVREMLSSILFGIDIFS